MLKPHIFYVFSHLNTQPVTLNYQPIRLERDAVLAVSYE